MKILAVIPARYGATRFPGMALAVIAGKPMIQHVYERCRAARGIDRVVVATDDTRIAAACRAFGAEARMTRSEHRSGTDRVAEAAAQLTAYEGILNVQGDEPAIETRTIERVASLLREQNVEVATAVAPLNDPAELSDPNVVKTVVTRSGKALYFSRAAIPFVRGERGPAEGVHYRHLGIYGFRFRVLQELAGLSTSPLEQAESLEQLRWLEAGYGIHCATVNSRSVGVDSPADIRRIEARMQEQSGQ